MSKTISAGGACTDPAQARLGGGALIGGVADWPRTPGGAPLLLLLSLPAAWLNAHAGAALPDGYVVSVFSTYAPADYFLDCITYHGNAAELARIEQGYTRVLRHRAGHLVHAGGGMPAHLLVCGADGAQGQQSRVGGQAALLQNDTLDLPGEAFVLQVCGALFPAPFDQVLYLRDAIAYLFLNHDLAASPAGHFFVQVT